MFEKEIKFITDISLNKVKKFGSFFTYEKLLTSDVHPAIIKYISAELDFLIYEDRRKLLQDSVFDYSGSEISKHFAVISEEIKKNKKISFEDMKKLMLQAVSFNINFLLRPRWSLIKHSFNESDKRSFDEISLAFNYIYFYDYLKNIFFAYLTKSKLTDLSITEFESILIKIDKELFANQPEKFLDNAIFSIAEFFNEGEVNKTKIIPAYFELLLKEKNLIEYQFKIRKYYQTDLNQSINAEDLRKVLFSTTQLEIPDSFKEEMENEKNELPFNAQIEKETLVTKEEEIILTPSDNKEIINKPIIETTSDKGKIENIKQNEKIIKNEEIEEDLLSIYDSELKSIEDELNEIKSDMHDFDFEIVDESQNIQEEKISDIVIDPDKSKDFNEKDESEDEDIINLDSESLGNNMSFEEKPEVGKKTVKRMDKDPFEYLSRKDIRKITAAVFNDDRDDFENTIEKISECISYEEATEILKTVFLTYRVNPYSNEAVTLTNAISNYFDQV